jgi:hypothetical protein
MYSRVEIALGYKVEVNYKVKKHLGVQKIFLFLYTRIMFGSAVVSRKGTAALLAKIHK